MFEEPAEPSMFDEIQTVMFAIPDKVGKVFRVLDENLRLCLICDEAFTAEGAAEHANVTCLPVPTHQPQMPAPQAVSSEPARSGLHR
jgi:hypothetical protein